jgi:hypothetical protein
MSVANILVWLVIIIPVFTYVLHKIAYPIGIVSALIEDFFEMFTYVGVDCKLIAIYSNILIVFMLSMLVIFLYNKVKT